MNCLACGDVTYNASGRCDACELSQDIVDYRMDSEQAELNAFGRRAAHATQTAMRLA